MFDTEGDSTGCTGSPVSAGAAVGNDVAEWTFPADPGAVRTARTAVRARLYRWGLDALTDLTVLLVSELVTNSLQHATGPIGVRLIRPSGLRDALRVEVSDPLPDPPRERPARPDDENGRGLRLLSGCCRDWGTRIGPKGKTVWFELPVPR